ncbi:MAG TPA: HAD-IA family hydrolase [Candidatus Saccharimonadales bacterium]|nr:HAD-IA family hydrolase [Candidatus Saccharimonadales bacterium]
MTFDAGGTLIEPWPSVGEVYAQAAVGHVETSLNSVQLDLQFREAWKSRANFSYSRAEWQELVRHTFRDVSADSAKFFDKLYARFGEADTWRIHDDVLPTLEHLRSVGMKMAVVSNWDERLKPLLKSLGLAGYFEEIVVSIEVGQTKPHPRIFEMVLRKLGLQPHETLHVGDSETEDLRGARGVGMAALLIRRGLATSPISGVIGALTELGELFRGH